MRRMIPETSADLDLTSTLSLLLPTFPNFLYYESYVPAPEQKCSETGPNRRCSKPKQYQKRFRYYH